MGMMGSTLQGKPVFLYHLFGKHNLAAARTTFPEICCQDL
jgi:hypothetical protein